MSKFTNLYIIDCGKNYFFFYNRKTGKIKTLRYKDKHKIINIVEEFGLEKGSLLVGESCHFSSPRKLASKAQPLLAEELLEMYANCEAGSVTFRLFPEKKTPKARTVAGLKKTDKNDVRSIAIYLTKFPHLKETLKNPPNSFEPTPRRKEGWRFKRRVNETLNAARSFDYQSPDDKMSAFARKHMRELIEWDMSDNLKSICGFEDCFYKNSRKGLWKKGDIKFKEVKMTQIATILAGLINYDGSLNFRDNDNLCGWDFYESQIIPNSPNHLRGGVARSNIYHWGMPPWISKKMAEELGVTQESILSKQTGQFTKKEHKLFSKYRKQYRKALRELFFILKKIIEREHLEQKDLRCHSVKSEFNS